jgi:prolipoprotein diacylglyceryltransferase
VGCWIRGCCHGKEFALGTGLSGRHPVQLYEAAGEVLVLALVVREFLRTSERANTLDSRWRWWAVPSCYLLFYGLLRGVTELFRGDPARGFLTEIHMPFLSEVLGVCPDLPLFLSTSQLIAGAMVLAGATGLWWTRRSRY